MIRTILLAVTICALCAGSWAAPLYTLTDLGTIPGDTGSEAWGMNNAGQVVGYSGPYNGSPDCHAFLYTGGQMHDLGNLGGYGMGNRANAINNNGQIVGWSTNASGDRDGFLYSNGQMQDLGNLGGIYGLIGSVAGGINDLGQVVGSAYTATFQLSQAFLYSGGQMQNLGNTLFGGILSWGDRVNNTGQIACGATIYGVSHSYLYSDGHLLNLGTLPGLPNSLPYGLNDAGQVAGVSSAALGGLGQAFLYSGGQLLPLGDLGGGKSEAFGINNAGQVVGQAYTASGVPHAFLYSGSAMIDLNTLRGCARTTPHSWGELPIGML